MSDPNLQPVPLQRWLRRAGHRPFSMTGVSYSRELRRGDWQGTVVDSAWQAELRGAALILIPTAGIVTVHHSSVLAQPCCTGRGLFIPEVQAVRLVPDMHTGSRTLVIRVQAELRETLLQGLSPVTTAFETTPLALSRTDRSLSASADPLAPVVMEFVAWRYAEHRAALARLPGSSQHRASLYTRLLAARSDCESDPEARIGDLGSSAHLSQAHFVRLFRAAFGRSPQEHLIHWRMIRAINYLIWSSIPVSEIGGLCGYADRTAFTRTFSRLLGQSPVQLRQAASDVAGDPARFLFTLIYEKLRC